MKHLEEFYILTEYMHSSTILGTVATPFMNLLINLTMLSRSGLSVRLSGWIGVPEWLQTCVGRLCEVDR